MEIGTLAYRSNPCQAKVKQMVKPGILKRMLSALWVCLMTGAQVQGQFTQGPLNPASFANNNTTCPFAYTSVAHIAPAGNVATSNNVYASASHCDCCDTQTSCLEARNYGFTIPGSATITGIRVEVERRRSAGAGGYIEDNGVMILKGGAYTGPNRANYGLNWPTTDAFVSYGGAGDLWGTTWTPADINAAGFGVAIASISYTCGSAMTSFVDHIRITVFYDDILGVSCSAFSAMASESGAQISWLMDHAEQVNQLLLEGGSSADALELIADLDPQCRDYADVHQEEGRRYYRLGWSDNDGNTGYSPVTEVSGGHDRGFTLVVNGKELVVNMATASDEAAEIAIMDAGGRRIAGETLPAGADSQRIMLPALSAGLYWVGVQGAGWKRFAIVGE